MEPTQEFEPRKIASVQSKVGKNRRSGYFVVPVLLIAAFTGFISVALGHTGVGPAPNRTAKTAIAQSAPPINFYLHGTGPSDNPPTLFLDNIAPTATSAKFKDSASINFNGGNPWKEVGTWAAGSALTSGMLTGLSDLHTWLGLKNSDDQGTNFDLRVELYKNNTLLAAGVTLCVVGVTKNADTAKEVTVSLGSFSPPSFNGPNDVLSLKILTRIGTNSTGALKLDKTAPSLNLTSPVSPRWMVSRICCSSSVIWRGANGSFSIANVLTIRGNIQVIAAGTVNNVPVTGVSAPFPPVAGGVTDVGTIIALENMFDPNIGSAWPRAMTAQFKGHCRSHLGSMACPMRLSL